TCADLSSHPETFHKQLRRHLALASRWNCIVLLKDAEVYLSERDENMDRNRILSIFLDALDSLSGTLFLTSTRVGLIDESLRHRIHIALSIPEPDRAAASHMWSAALHSVKTLNSWEVDYRGILSWAEARYKKRSVSEKTWSSRQVSNAIETAMAVASFD
ncbi:hypothetical protein B0T26DRAFT_620469, partial [Lasiosphaeria miniovina]